MDSKNVLWQDGRPLIIDLEWLEYNLKRALMIECADEEEQKLGICEIHETIRRVAYYSSVKEELLERLRML